MKVACNQADVYGEQQTHQQNQWLHDVLVGWMIGLSKQMQQASSVHTASAFGVAAVLPLMRGAACNMANAPDAPAYASEACWYTSSE